MDVEKVKKEFVALGIPREEVEYAFNDECRNAMLAGMIDRLPEDKRKIANSLLRLLGPDSFEVFFEKKFGKKVDTVKMCREFWKE